MPIKDYEDASVCGLDADQEPEILARCYGGSPRRRMNQ